MFEHIWNSSVKKFFCFFLRCFLDSADHSFHTSVLTRAVILRPDLSCLWKLLGDACTVVIKVSPNRAMVQVPSQLAGLDSNTQSHTLNQAQILKVGERYVHKQVLSE